jgi:Carbohydrate-binding module 48 (Isoamylase N-terminal domain)
MFQEHGQVRSWRNAMEKTKTKKSEKIVRAKPSSQLGKKKENEMKKPSMRPKITKRSADDIPVTENPPEKARGIRKEYLGSDAPCLVTLRLPKKAAGAAERVVVAGEFNGWDEDTMPMKRLKNGDFEIIFEVRSGRAYRFRYLLDGCRWENDWSADAYAPNPYGGDDSVLIT